MDKTVEQIFLSPPSGPAELDQILSRLDKEDVRQALFAMLEQGFFSTSNYSLFSAIIAEVGVCEHREHLIQIVSDVDRDMLVRQFAIAALAQEDPQMLSVELEHLSPQMLQSLGDLPLIELMTMVQADPSDADQVTALIEQTSEEMWELLIYNLGKCRRQVGTPAAFAYSHALSIPQLSSIHQLMLDAVIAEGGNEGEELLIDLRDNETNDDNRRRFQKALLKLGTTSIENTNEPKSIKGRAYVGNCDGQGAFILLGRFDVSESNTVTTNLCIRVASDIRDGFVLPSQPEEEFLRMLNEIKANPLNDFVEISLGETASLVADAMARTRDMGTEILPEAKPSIRLFEKTDPIDLPNISDKGFKKEELLESLRSLLKEETIFATWFFDMGDLLGSDVEPPENTSFSEKWYADAAIQLGTTPIRDRVIAMVEYMYRWHVWKNKKEPSAQTKEPSAQTKEPSAQTKEPSAKVKDTAELLAAAAKEVENDFANSALIRVMLERSIRQPGSAEDLLMQFDNELDVGNPDIRGLLRIKFFSNLKWPRGKHLSQLDLAEVAFTAMDSAMNTLPAERRPREDERLTVAFEIGKSVSKTMIRGDDFDEDDLDKLVKRLARISSLSKNEATQIVGVVLPKIGDFFSTVCEFCEVDCVARPETKMSDAFFGDEHPGNY